MVKLIVVIVAALAIGIAGGAAFFWWNHHQIEETFVPYNSSADPTRLRESQ